MAKIRELLRAVADIVLGIASVAASLALFKFAIMPVLGHALDPTASSTTLIRRTGTAFSILFGYWAFARFRERRRPSELRPTLSGIAVGTLSGAALISLTTSFLFAVGAYEVTTYHGWHIELIDVAGVILIAAILEEVVFRGIAFRLLERALGTPSAALITAVIFGIAHLPNLSDQPSAITILTTFVLVTLIGGFWTVLYARVRNLWFIIIHHAAWNFAIVLTGASLSGVDEWRAAAPIAIADHGPAWLTGGVFGPEDSVLTIGVVTVSLLLVLFWRPTGQPKAVQALRSPERECKRLEVVALRDTASRLTELWSPRVVAAVDDYYVKVCKVHGTFGWHSHETDELFIVLKGGLIIEFADSRIALAEGDGVVVPKGVLHNPIASNECLLMLFEHSSTLHAGNGHAVLMPQRTIEEQLRPARVGTS